MLVAQRPEVFDARCLLSEFRSRWIRAKRDVTSGIYFEEINACVCVCVRENAYTPAHTRDRVSKTRRVRRKDDPSLWDILQSALISYRVHLQNFKNLSYFFLSHHRRTLRAKASNVKGKARSVKRTMRVTLPQTGGTLILCEVSYGIYR